MIAGGWSRQEKPPGQLISNPVLLMAEAGGKALGA